MESIAFAATFAVCPKVLWEMAHELDPENFGPSKLKWMHVVTLWFIIAMMNFAIHRCCRRAYEAFDYQKTTIISMLKEESQKVVEEAKKEASVLIDNKLSKLSIEAAQFVDSIVEDVKSEASVIIDKKVDVVRSEAILLVDVVKQEAAALIDQKLQSMTGGVNSLASIETKINQATESFGSLPERITEQIKKELIPVKHSFDEHMIGIAGMIPDLKKLAEQKTFELKKECEVQFVEPMKKQFSEAKIQALELKKQVETNVTYFGAGFKFMTISSGMMLLVALWNVVRRELPARKRHESAGDNIGLWGNIITCLGVVGAVGVAAVPSLLDIVRVGGAIQSVGRSYNVVSKWFTSTNDITTPDGLVKQVAEVKELYETLEEDLERLKLKQQDVDKHEAALYKWLYKYEVMWTEFHFLVGKLAYANGHETAEQVDVLREKYQLAICNSKEDSADRYDAMLKNIDKLISDDHYRLVDGECLAALRNARQYGYDLRTQFKEIAKASRLDMAANDLYIISHFCPKYRQTILKTHSSLQILYEAMPEDQAKYVESVLKNQKEAKKKQLMYEEQIKFLETPVGKIYSWCRKYEKQLAMGTIMATVLIVFVIVMVYKKKKQQKIVVKDFSGKTKELESTVTNLDVVRSYHMAVLLDCHTLAKLQFDGGDQIDWTGPFCEKINPGDFVPMVCLSMENCKEDKKHHDICHPDEVYRLKQCDKDMLPESYTYLCRKCYRLFAVMTRLNKKQFESFRRKWLTTKQYEAKGKQKHGRGQLKLRASNPKKAHVNKRDYFVSGDDDVEEDYDSWLQEPDTWVMDERPAVYDPYYNKWIVADDYQEFTETVDYYDQLDGQAIVNYRGRDMVWKSDRSAREIDDDGFGTVDRSRGRGRGYEAKEATVTVTTVENQTRVTSDTPIQCVSISDRLDEEEGDYNVTDAAVIAVSVDGSKEVTITGNVEKFMVDTDQKINMLTATIESFIGTFDQYLQNNKTTVVHMKESSGAGAFSTSESELETKRRTKKKKTVVIKSPPVTETEEEGIQLEAKKKKVTKILQRKCKAPGCDNPVGDASESICEYHRQKENGNWCERTCTACKEKVATKFDIYRNCERNKKPFVCYTCFQNIKKEQVKREATVPNSVQIDYRNVEKQLALVYELFVDQSGARRKGKFIGHLPCQSVKGVFMKHYLDQFSCPEFLITLNGREWRVDRNTPKHVGDDVCLINATNFYFAGYDKLKWRRADLKEGDFEKVSMVCWDDDAQKWKTVFGEMNCRGEYQFTTKPGDCGAYIISMEDGKVVGLHNWGHEDGAKTINGCILYDATMQGYLAQAPGAASKLMQLALNFHKDQDSPTEE